MTDDIIIGGKTEIPIIEKSVEQKLIITFKKGPNGEGNITFHFEPDMEVAVTPEQRAAQNVAQQVINLFQLDQTAEKQNAESSDNVQ